MLWLTMDSFPMLTTCKFSGRNLWGQTHMCATCLQSTVHSFVFCPAEGVPVDSSTSSDNILYVTVVTTADHHWALMRLLQSQTTVEDTWLALYSVVHTGIIPDSRESPAVVTLHKSGDNGEVNSYHTICKSAFWPEFLESLVNMTITINNIG